MKTDPDRVLGVKTDSDAGSGVTDDSDRLLGVKSDSEGGFGVNSDSDGPAGHFEPDALAALGTRLGKPVPGTLGRSSPG